MYFYLLTYGFRCQKKKEVWDAWYACSMYLIPMLYVVSTNKYKESLSTFHTDWPDILSTELKGELEIIT